MRKTGKEMTPFAIVYKKPAGLKAGFRAGTEPQKRRSFDLAANAGEKRRKRKAYSCAAPKTRDLDQPAFNRNRLKAEKLIDSKVLEQLIRVQVDAGCSRKPC